MVTNLGSTMNALRCSFCNKPLNEVGKLIAGPSVFICDECIAVCNDIIADDIVELQELKRRERTYRPEVGKENPAGIVPGLPLGLSLQCSLCRMPTDMGEGLLIPNRGIICVGCVGEIEAAIAERREPEI